jgi:reductive dehalogenase
MTALLNILLIATAILFFVSLVLGGIVSLKEHEKQAAGRFFMLAVIMPIPFMIAGLVSFEGHEVFGMVLIALTFLTVILFLVPSGNNTHYEQPTLRVSIDERDTMFSRNELQPGTDRFESYYALRPEHKAKDDLFRQKAGLLQKGSSHYHPLNFAAADASFETIEALKDKVDGPVSDEVIKAEPEAITRYIKTWSKKLGAISCGITELKPYHLYSVGGRAERYGKQVKKEHGFAIAFTVEMDREQVDSAPASSIVMESGQQYLESGIIALQVASFIRNLGYPARAHIDGNYQVVCPLVARDSGLGEIGRMGLLMTPELGPRVRISVVTTDLQLIHDKPVPDFSTIDFCTMCKKCAETCPSKAISFEDRKEIDGALRWQINQEDCFTLWCETGTDCGRCMSVCPYSHPDNSMHNLVRKGLRQSHLFRKAALSMDDYFYGRKPAVKPLPPWMQTET